MKKIAAGLMLVGALAFSGLGMGAGIANADHGGHWGHGGWGGGDGDGGGWNGGAWNGGWNGWNGGYGYGGCGNPWIPPAVSAWIPPAVGGC